MKMATAILAAVLATGLMATTAAEAKRLGGARSSGMQRQQVNPPAKAPAAQPQAPGAPAQAAPAAGTTAAAAAPAAATAKRSWAGPLAGLAAGLGLAALASAFGLGEAFANMMLIALLAMVAMAVIGFLLRKRAAAAGAAAMPGSPMPATGPMARTGMGGTRIGSALGGGAPAAATAATAAAGAWPQGFDAESFARTAKAQFMALQEANDAGDLARLRDYLTPQMYEVVAADLQARGAATQRTEVFGLQAQVVSVVEEADGYVASVRFTGSTRDQAGAVPEDLDEVWHLTKPRTGFGGWVVAGIQQAQ